MRTRLALGLAALSLAVVPTAACAATAPAAVVATTPAPTTATPRPVIAWNHAIVYLNRTQTYQVGNGGAWAVAGAVGLALAPATAGVGTVAAIGVGLALGAVGSKVVDYELSIDHCLSVNIVWIGNTGAHVGWYPCPGARVVTK